MSSICPTASASIVFRDGSGNWRGRYRDHSHDVQDVSLASQDGEQARQVLAKYLGVPASCIRVLNASHGVTYLRGRAG